MSKPKLVIIGAGVAGLHVAQSTTAVLDVTIIDKKDFFEYNPANVRSVVDTSLIEKEELPYKEFKNIGNFVQGSVVKLDTQSNEVVLAGGQTFPFDYAVIATGSTYNSAFGKPSVTSMGDRKKQLKEFATQIKEADSVLVVGGGATGVELAAEILEGYPGKKLTLVNGGNQLLMGQPAIMATRAQAFLESKGGKVILNSRVKSVEGSSTEFETTAGEKITAQAVFWAIGGKADSSWLKENSPELLNELGQVKVDEFLKVEGLPNVFATGDISSTQETKTAYNAGESGKLLGANLKAIVKAGAGKAKLKAWKPDGGMPVQFVSLGRKSGTGHMGSMTAPAFMVVWMKSKELFVPKTRKDFGFPA